MQALQWPFHMCCMDDSQTTQNIPFGEGGWANSTTRGRTGGSLQMNRWSLRNNRLKFET